MRRVVSIAFWIFFAVTSVAGFLIALALWVVTTPFDPNRRLNHYFSCAWAALYVLVYPGWTARVLHRDRIDPKKTYVLVANHTSVADIVLCFTLFRQFKWVSKKSVFNVPLIGWNMRLCGYVPLVRGNATSIEAMMGLSKKWLLRGVSIMMFPEGTRSEDGALKPFKRGAFTLALETGVSVIPIAIHGGRDLIPKHGKTFSTRANLVVEVLDPVPPAGFTDPLEYGASVRSILECALESRLGGLDGPERTRAADQRDLTDATPLR